MIQGVVVKRLVRHCDDRGFFEEIIRCDEGILDSLAQVSVAKTYPGVIKAFHYHEYQQDLWFFPVGNVQVVLHDLREESSTYGVTQVLYTGEDNPLALLIPPRVAHGYRTLGDKPALICYVTSRTYNKDCPDEKRLPFDDPKIAFDWTTKMR